MCVLTNLSCARLSLPDLNTPIYLMRQELIRLQLSCMAPDSALSNFVLNLNELPSCPRLAHTVYGEVAGAVVPHRRRGVFLWSLSCLALARRRLGSAPSSTVALCRCGV